MHGSGGDPDSADLFMEHMRDDRSAETGVGVSSSPHLPAGPAGLQDVQVDEEGETRFEVLKVVTN